MSCLRQENLLFYLSCEKYVLDHNFFVTPYLNTVLSLGGLGGGIFLASPAQHFFGGRGEEEKFFPSPQPPQKKKSLAGNTRLHSAMNNMIIDDLLRKIWTCLKMLGTQSGDRCSSHLWNGTNITVLIWFLSFPVLTAAIHIVYSDLCW